jgi:Protein of unknown function (DUF1385)
VQSRALTEVLKRADRARALPRLGGMARPDGVVIVSERYWAFAGVDGRLREGTMPQPPRALSNVPFARGLIRLGLALAPLLSKRGAARPRERLFVLAALVLPFSFVALPSAWTLPAGIVLTVALLATLLRGRALALHGAEHRAIAAAEERRLGETFDGTARPSRFSPRCGTNFAAIALPTAFAAQEVWPLTPALWTPLVVTSLALALSMELWRIVQAAQRGPLKLFLLPGLALQRLTTREPRPDETKVALAAVASVLRRELASDPRR